MKRALNAQQGVSATIDEWNPNYSLEASVAMRSKMSFTKEFKIAIALLEIPVSGWTCLRTTTRSKYAEIW